MKTITIFTPTYNRAYCLHKCYESLCRQTSKDFEWLIIDDGSTDNTAQLVQSWRAADNGFAIRYLYKENGGMHTGYNLAYENIETELSMNVDSDDWLPDTAIETILAFWSANKRPDVGGIYALDQYENGAVIGTPFPEDLKEFRGWGYKMVYYEANGTPKRYVNHGDKKFIGVTAAIRQYPPIPVFPGERYYSLYYKQHRLERDYTILILNQPVCTVEYMADGSSSNMYHQYVRNPRGFCDERLFVMQYAPSFRLKLVSAVHYVAESRLMGNRRFLQDATNKPAVLLALLPGLLLYRWIRYKTKPKK